MMLNITDALPLILERSGRRTEILPATFLALLFARWNSWRMDKRYPAGARPTGMSATTVLVAVSMTENDVGV